MTVTNKFELEEKVYFKILLRTRLLNLWWFYLLLIALAIANLKTFGESRFSTYMVVLGVLYPIFSFFYLYSRTVSRKNKVLFTPRVMKFNESHLILEVEGGEVNKVPFGKIVRVVETRTFFLLYLTQHQFIYIPKNSFNAENDLVLFGTCVQRSLNAAEN